MKPLAAWTRDLLLRVDQFAKWAATAHQPNIFWMSGFTFPTGFLTAVLQTAARQNNVSVDSLSWEFVVSTVDDSNITQQPKVTTFVFLLSYSINKKITRPEYHQLVLQGIQINNMPSKSLVTLIINTKCQILHLIRKNVM